MSTALSRLVASGALSPDQAAAVRHELAVVQESTTGAVTAGVSGTASATGSETGSPAVTPVPSPADGTGTAGRPASPGPGVPGSAATRGSRMSWTALLAEVGGYVGGVFVAAAVAVLAGDRWDQMSLAGRLAILGVPAVLMLVAAWFVTSQTPGGWTVHSRKGSTPRRRLVAVLFLAAGALLAGMTANILGDATDDEFTWVAGTALVAWGLGYAACRSTLLHLGAVGALVVTSTSAVATQFDPSTGRNEQLYMGLTMLAVAVVWLALTLLSWLDEGALGLFVAGVLAFIGGEILATRGQDVAGLGYLVLGILAVTCLAGYMVTRHIAVLVVGVVSLATVVPQAVTDYAAGAFGAAGALMITGLSIIGASALGFRLTRIPEAEPHGTAEGQAGVPSR